MGFLLAVDGTGPDGTVPCDRAAHGDPRLGSCIGSAETMSRDLQASQGVQTIHAN